MRVEEITDAGLVIMRGAIEPELSADYAAECNDFFMNYDGEITSTRGARSPGAIETLRLNNTITFEKLGYKSVVRVLEQLEIPRLKSFAINLQNPHSYQRFHPDLGKQLPLIIIHPTGEGALDYFEGQFRSEEEAIENHKTVELEPGDVIKQFLPYIHHRGFNRGDTTRLTTVSY